MLLQTWNADMRLYGDPSAANQEAYVALQRVVEYSEKRVDRRVIVEADRDVEACLLEFLESTDIRVFQGHSVVGDDGYLGVCMQCG